ncbi:MAG: hypothetical protein LAC70_08640 [Methylovulum sp.]|nr:hypothetical protein [Methylovulum sp.]TSA37229.1 MAG: hypothetical protein D4R63_13090 [Methylococcaceae bacterium]
MQLDITLDVANALGFYVYAYIDPRDESVFYIGKGVGTRATDHLLDKSESKKVARINGLLAAGFEPRIDIVAHQLRDDLEASRVEAALIELIGVDQLTNLVRGRFSTDYPRRSLVDFIMEHAPQSVEVTDPALLIRINRQFKYGMSAQELYESTRGIWVVGERRNRAKFAMAVYAGVVLEVYEIESWHRAGSTDYATRVQAELAKQESKRWEFLGHVAFESIRSRYIGRSVAHLFRAGQQSPVVGIALDG